MERYFGFTSDAKIVSLGSFEADDSQLDSKLEKAAVEKSGSREGFFLTLNQVYQLVETGKEALNTP